VVENEKENQEYGPLYEEAPVGSQVKSIKGLLKSISGKKNTQREDLGKKLVR